MDEESSPTDQDNSIEPLLDYDSSSRRQMTEQLDLSASRLVVVPHDLHLFNHLRHLDVSNNELRCLSDSVCNLVWLECLEARNNRLKELPAALSRLRKLAVVNVSGNALDSFPGVLCDMPWIRDLQIGANGLERLPETVGRMKGLVHFYLGGNRLQRLPRSLGKLEKLEALHLNDNMLDQLPTELHNLSSLKTLSLHGNQLASLPSHIMRLQCLRNISLRNNPLVLKFVREHFNDVASLLELAGRCIKHQSIPYDSTQLPRSLVVFLNSAKCCDNPACSGVYFTQHVRQIKFVDFCGKYRIPLMHYLCSSCCDESVTGNPEEETDDKLTVKQVNKVLLS